MRDDKPTIQERLAVAAHSGETLRSDVSIADGNTDRFGLYEHLGGILIFLDAVNPDRPKDAQSVAEGSREVEEREVTDQPNAGARGTTGNRKPMRKVVSFELERRRVYLRDRIAQEREEAIELLTIIGLRKCRGYTEATMKPLARLSLVEWHNRNCSSCRGVKMLTAENGVRVICQKCQGSGVRRFKDAERAEALSVDRRQVREHTPALTFLAGVIGDAISRKIRAVAPMINNWGA